MQQPPNELINQETEFSIQEETNSILDLLEEFENDDFYKEYESNKRNESS